MNVNILLERINLLATDVAALIAERDSLRVAVSFKVNPPAVNPPQVKRTTITPPKGYDEGECSPDPAAILGAAVSLYETGKAYANEHNINLSELYNGADEWMRSVHSAAVSFEAWACDHVAFEELSDVWSYFLEDKFGPACVALFGIEHYGSWDQHWCVQVAGRLRLPLRK